jgi:protein-tyrosine phosphatase
VNPFPFPTYENGSRKDTFPFFREIHTHAADLSSAPKSGRLMGMNKILFVCLGNICRSPTAEAVMIDRIQKAGLSDAYEIDSAGILAAHQGEPADARMRAHASKRGYALTSRSRPVRESDFYDFDHIIAMDHSNLDDLKERAPNDAYTATLSLLLCWLPNADVSEVPDPYYGGPEGFDQVLDLVEAACDALLLNLETR